MMLLCWKLVLTNGAYCAEVFGGACLLSLLSYRLYLDRLITDKGVVGLPGGLKHILRHLSPAKANVFMCCRPGSWNQKTFGDFKIQKVNKVPATPTAVKRLKAKANEESKARRENKEAEHSAAEDTYISDKTEEPKEAVNEEAIDCSDIDVSEKKEVETQDTEKSEENIAMNSIKETPRKPEIIIKACRSYEPTERLLTPQNQRVEPKPETKRSQEEV